MSSSAAQKLLKDYQANYGGPTKGTNVNSLGSDMQKQFNAYEPYRQYAEQAQAKTFNRDRTMQGDLIAGQKAVAGIQADASKYGARKSAEASQFGAAQGTEQARIGADASKYAAGQSAAAQKYAASQSAGASRYSADANLRGTKYSADAGLAGTRDTNQANIRMTGMQQAGETSRTLLSQVAETGREGMRQSTARQGNLFSLATGLASRRRSGAPIARYWN